MFSIALAKLLPSCLFIPLRPAAEAQGTVASSFLPQWSQAVDGLLEASIFDEKSVDELSKGHLPSTAVGISSILPVEIARSEAPGNRPTTYVAELYAVVARAFVDRPYKAPSSLFALDAGMERIINVSCDAVCKIIYSFVGCLIHYTCVCNRFSSASLWASWQRMRQLLLGSRH